MKVDQPFDDRNPGLFVTAATAGADGLATVYHSYLAANASGGQDAGRNIDLMGILLRSTLKSVLILCSCSMDTICRPGRQEKYKHPSNWSQYQQTTWEKLVPNHCRLQDARPEDCYILHH